MIVFSAAAVMSVTGAVVSLLRGKPVRLDEPVISDGVAEVDEEAGSVRVN